MVTTLLFPSPSPSPSPSDSSESDIRTFQTTPTSQSYETPPTYHSEAPPTLFMENTPTIYSAAMETFTSSHTTSIHSHHPAPPSQITPLTPHTHTELSNVLPPTPDLVRNDNSSLPYLHKRYTTLAVAASLLVLLNILLITGALVLVTLCLRRHYKRSTSSEDRDGTTIRDISGPMLEAESVRSRVRNSRNSGESHQLNRRSQDTVSMISNLLYSSSPARAPSQGGEGEGGREGGRPQLDSMIYNGAYGGRAGKVTGAAETSNAAPRNIYSSTDNDGYEYIEDYL